MPRTLAAILCILASLAPAFAQAPRLQTILKDGALEVFLWTDSCNVYVVQDGNSAILIDLGDAGVLGQLKSVGVETVDWVLLTHHHREQAQGHLKLKGSQTQFAAPEKERQLFEKPTDFRKVKPSLGDRFSVHGASYVRPLVEPLKIHRGFKPMDTFTWRGHEFWCLETAGNSPGGMSYLIKTSKGWIGFSGDVMLAGAKMHNWFDTEWDYGFAKGLYTLIESVSLLESFEPVILMPSHGPVVADPKGDLKDYQAKLKKLARLYVRGYNIFTFSGAEQDKFSRPSAVPHLWQITKHLYKFKGPNVSPNFTLLIADSGRALMIDCGIDPKTLDATFEAAKERLGLKSIDAILVTHMHGDHCTNAPYAREKYGAKVWTLDRVAPPVEEPERFEYCAMPWSYGANIGPIKFDRLFKPGEKFTWEGYELAVDWMPGQTEFGCCIQGMIDGKRVAFTGDNIFADPDDPAQNGHEALCARNSAILEEGYIFGAEYLKKLKPDLIVGGHSYIMNNPAGLIDRYHAWGLAMRDAFKAVSAEDDYRIMFDPYWVRPDPYRAKLAQGDTAQVTLHVRNFLNRSRKHRLVLQCPEGITAEPTVIEGTVPAESIAPLKVQLKATATLGPGPHIVAIDATLDGKRYGQWFDFIVIVPPNK